MPLYVYLLPLERLNDKAAKILLEIKKDLINKVSRYFDEFDEYIRTCNDYAKNQVSAIFPKVKDEFDSLKQIIKQYKLRFQTEISKILPKIRGGWAKNEDLGKILTKYKSSPLNSYNLQKWILLKKQKVEHLQGIVKHLKDISITFVSSAGLKGKLVDPNVNYVIIFVLRLFRNEDTYLNSLKSYIRTGKPNESKIEKPWYSKDYSVFVNISKQIRTLNNTLKYYSTNKKVSFYGSMEYFTTKDYPNKGSFFVLIDKTTGTTHQDFKFPTWIDKEQDGKPLSFGNQTHSIISIKWAEPKTGSESVEKYRIYYTRETNKNGPLSSWHVEETSKRHTAKNICDLARNTKYVFIMEAWCIFGPCFRSHVSEPITTTPGSGLLPLKHCKWVEQKHWRKEADTCKILQAADVKPLQDRIHQLEVKTDKGNRKGRNDLLFIISKDENKIKQHVKH